MLSANAASTSSTSTATPIPNGEIQRLEGVIQELKAEIGQYYLRSYESAPAHKLLTERSQKDNANRAAETQAMFDRFVEDHRVVAGDVGDMSVDLMIAPARDEEKERLQNIKQQLDEERKRFTEAAIKLGKEKAVLEVKSLSQILDSYLLSFISQAERLQFLDEKRSWQVEMMLADLPATPNPSSPARPSVVKKSPRKSPRKSPAKVTVGKAGSGRKIRVSRRSSLLSPPRFEPAYETEVLPPLPAPSFPSFSVPLPSASSLLPTSFVLPPPSPRASLPAQPALLQSAPLLEINIQSQPSTSTAATELAVPCTPPGLRRPFPIAKPLALRMTHAYSPAKPSPLSRILLLGNSPTSPDFGSGDSQPLEALLEVDETPSLFPEIPSPPNCPSLAEELGVSQSPPESPLQEKKIAPNVAPVSITTGALPAKRVFHPEPNRFTTQEKGKSKAAAVVVPPTQRQLKTAGAVEKENTELKRKVVGVPKVSPPAGGNVGGEEGKRKPAVQRSSTSRARVMAKVPPPPTNGKGGPRRVLVDSAEAPQIARGKRG